MIHCLYFEYPHDNSHRPLRVTDGGIEPLFFTLSQTIELVLGLHCAPSVPAASHAPFASPTATPPLDIAPLGVSLALGGVSFPVIHNDHSPSLLETVQKAVETARKAPFPRDRDEVRLQLRIRICRCVKERTMFGLLTNEKKTLLVEFVYKIIKTRREFTNVPVVLSTEQSTPVSNASFPQGSNASASSAIAFASATNASFSTSPAGGGGGSQANHRIIYSNDPEEVRSALDDTLMYCFNALNRGLSKQLASVGGAVTMFEVECTSLSSGTEGGAS